MIRDVLVDITNGQIQFVVVEVRLASGETRLIAVPMQVLRWDPAAVMFGFTVDLTTLKVAPFRRKHHPRHPG
jgi:hypothetical protein